MFKEYKIRTKGDVMKKKLMIACFVIFMIAMVSNSLAGSNLVKNGDFEMGWDPNYWTTWWGVQGDNVDIGDHTANYGQTIPNEDAAIFWPDNGFFQDITVVPGAKYAFSGDLINAGPFPLLDTMRAIIKAEIGEDVDNGQWFPWWVQEIYIDSTAEPNEWITPTGDTIITNTVDVNGDFVGATRIRMSLIIYKDGLAGSGHGYFDNIFLEEIDRPADFNKDGIINFLDFTELANYWQKSTTTHDLVGNNEFVDINDLEAFATQWLWEEAEPQLAKVISPAHKSTNNPLDTVLVWRAGREAVAHDVYFSESYTDVKDANTFSDCYIGQQIATTYDPCGLELMKTYYWRVDEVNSLGDVLQGPVWQFDTIKYVIVEDFESYDNDGNSITDVWTDKLGWGDMQILLMNDPCISPVNSMRLRYQIPYNPYYAITNRSFSPAQDWTVNGVKMLTIHCYGDAANFELPVFVTIGDGTTDANVVADVNTLTTGWNEINVSLPEIATAGVDINNVSYMEIGFGDGTNKGMSASKWNILYIDDIALSLP